MIKKYLVLLVALINLSIFANTLESRYDRNLNIWYEDSWIRFINEVNSGKIVFTYPIAVISYLISNVKIFNSRPEECDTEFKDSISITIYILRWEF